MGASSTTSRKLPLLYFTFLCALTGIWANFLIPLKYVEVIEGQYVELHASYTGGNPNSKSIAWNFLMPNTTQMKMIISYTNNKVNVFDGQFKDRVGFLSKMPSSDVSFYINNTREADSGSYILQNINDGITGTVPLDVKVPPSVPKCSMTGKPELKGNVTLTCKSSSGKPIPLYKWKKTSPTSEVFFSPMLNEKTGTLKLNNLSSNMSGKYVCTASNTVAEKTCEIDLHITNSNKVGVIVGATVGSVAGFIFLLFVCLAFVFMIRRRNNEDDLANEIKEDAQAPKRVSWAKSGMGSDIISKNGTLSSIASSPHHKESSHHHNNHHHHLQQYPQRPPSDTASIITATGSNAGYRPSRHQGASTPTHYSYNNNTTLPREQLLSPEVGSNGGSMPRPERYTQLPQAQALPQTYNQPRLQLQTTPSPPPLPTSTIMASNISRMGGVPIMVPAQNQAGSLV
ncbi:endothelial cell adhesion molecule a [Oreochromis aureus]|uniref:Ig-like domain-containing protein n=1 Tax=Oreochromis aureus TaxID=47969 RepID=A0AAZ1Y5H5_OREAU|nr:endothelial cell adhesion molecule a [Oreochromis aureus]